MMTRIERPLSDEQQSHLKARLANASTESMMALVKTGAASAAVCGVLAIVTLVASTAPRGVVIAFWALLWLVFASWIGLPWRRLMRGQARMLAEAIRTNRAREIRVQTTRVVEFEEEEDEGRKLPPERVVPTAVKNRLELPEHLTMVPGTLERIEASLPRRSAR
jgi:hypothetical protein